MAASLTLEMSSVLHYMHSQEVVHLDVTPANVILGSPARLIDLSLARSVEEAATAGYGAGTRGFQAPEILDPQSPHRVGSWSDIWSLGATIHVGLTGRRVSDVISLPAVVPVALRELVDAMLAKEPTSRPTAAAVFDAADALLADLPAPRIDFFHPRGKA